MKNALPPTPIVKNEKVLFLPYYKSNPYLNLLSDALRPRNLTTTGGDFTWHIVKRVKKRQPNVIHFHWLHQWTNSSSAFKLALALPYWITQLVYLKAKGTRTAWTIHNLKDHENRSPVKDYIFSYLMASICDTLICHSNQAAASAAKFFKQPSEKIKVIPHGNYIGWYANTTSKAEARERLSIPNDAKVILSFGEQRHYKNTHILIEAFNAAEQNNAVLLIAGRCADKAYRSKLEDAAARNPSIRTCFEFISDDDVQLYLNASDALALPYSGILTSGAALLGMSFGLPILAPSLPCFKECPGKNGAQLYDDPDDPVALAKALQELLTCDEKRLKMSRHNIDLAESLEWDSIGRSTAIAYQSERTDAI